MNKSLCYRTELPITIIQVGGVFDLQNSLSNLPGIIWAKYPKEKHILGYSYLGLASRLDIRLNKNDQY